MLMSGKTWLDVPHDLARRRRSCRRCCARPGTRRSPPASGTTARRRSSGPSPTPGPSSSAAWPTTPRSRSPTCATARSATGAWRRSSPASSSPTRRSTSSRSRSRRRAVLLLRGVHRPARPAQPAGEVPGRSTTRTARRCRPTSCPQPPFDNGMTKDIRDENLAPYPRTREVIGDQLCEYYGLITHLDEQVGRILAALEKIGPREGHARHLRGRPRPGAGQPRAARQAEPLRAQHEAPADHRRPRHPGRAVHRPRSPTCFDLFPTICDLAGVKPPDGLAGRDLRPLWAGTKDAKIRESVFLPFSGLMRSVRDERWKLIVYPPINHRQLFDLRDDPDETRDLAADPAHEPEIERLTALMKAWQEKVGDRQPLTVAKPKPKEVRFDDLRPQAGPVAARVDRREVFPGPMSPRSARHAFRDTIVPSRPAAGFTRGFLSRRGISHVALRRPALALAGLRRDGSFAPRRGGTGRREAIERHHLPGRRPRLRRPRRVTATRGSRPRTSTRSPGRACG